MSSMDEPHANSIEKIRLRSDGDRALTTLFGATDLVTRVVASEIVGRSPARLIPTGTVRCLELRFCSEEVPYHRDRRCRILLHDPMT
jgi:hypothetical protein